MPDFLQLFNTSDFVTRDHCGTGWTHGLIVAYIVSNLTIALAYFAIPAMLLVLYRSKRHDLPRPEILILFIAFIVLCGFTHLTDVIVFFWPGYRLFTGFYAATAITSIATACYLPSVVKTLVKLPSREYAHSLNDRLQTELYTKEILRRETEARYQAIRKEAETAKKALEARLWATGTQDTLARIERITAILTESPAAGDPING